MWYGYGAKKRAQREASVLNTLFSGNFSPLALVVTKPEAEFVGEKVGGTARVNRQTEQGPAGEGPLDIMNLVWPNRSLSNCSRL